MAPGEISRLTNNPHATGEDATTWKGRLSLKGSNNVRIDVCLKAVGKVNKVGIILPFITQIFGQRPSGIIWGGYDMGEIGPPKHFAVFWRNTQPPPDSDGVDAERGRDEISAGASGR